MNWDWKDYFIATTLGMIVILATFTIVDWTIERDSSIGVGVAIGFIGTILGGALSGAITLIGVRLTIEQQTKMFEKQEQRIIEGKYNKVQFIKTEVFHLIIGVQSAIKSFREDNYEENLDSVYLAANELENISKGLYSKAAEIDAKLLMSLKSACWAAQDIKEFIDEAKEKDYGEEYVIRELINGRYYNRLALADYEFWETVSSFKLKQE